MFFYKDSNKKINTKKNIVKLAKLLLIEEIIEESDKHNVSKRTMNFDSIQKELKQIQYYNQQQQQNF